MLVQTGYSLASYFHQIVVSEVIPSPVKSVFDNLMTAAHDRNMLQLLLNPCLILLTLLVIFMAFWVKNKKYLGVVIALWGYGLTYHYSLWNNPISDQYLERGMTYGTQIGIFFAGGIATTAVILYLFLVSD